MALYVYNERQIIVPNGNALLNDSISCNKGYVLHQNGFGLLTLRGIVNGCGNFARYEIIANGNMGIPTGGTVEAIALALALVGEEIPTSKAIVTPAAVEEFFNFTCSTIITVPRGCCYSVALENVLPGVFTATGTVDVETAQNVAVQNLNVNVKRIA